VIDNAWLWHADHDDCDLKSDNCHSKHALVVNGKRVVAYGLSAEHTAGGDIVRWNGEYGETYFYQSELPYNAPEFGVAGYAGYAVASHLRYHKAVGLGVYIVGGMRVDAAYTGSSDANISNLVTVVIGKEPRQFKHMACTRWHGTEKRCLSAAECDDMRCVLPSFDFERFGGVATPWTRVFEVVVKTARQALADTSVGSTYSLLVAGEWTEEQTLCESAASGSEVHRRIELSAWPSKLRLQARGADSWGIESISLVSEGHERVLLDSTGAEAYGDNLFWLDGSPGAVAPAVQTYVVPAFDAQWSKELELPFSKTRGYETAPLHRLRVTILTATRLKKSDLFGGADPYCVVALVDMEGRQRARFETDSAQNTLDPHWNASSVLSSSYTCGSLVFSVWDKDFVQSTVLGRATLVANDIYPRGFDGELPLETSGGAGPGGNAQRPMLRVKVEVLAPGAAAVDGFLQEKSDGSLTHIVRGDGPQGRFAIVFLLFVAAIAFFASSTSSKFCRFSAPACIQARRISRNLSREPAWTPLPSWEALEHVVGGRT